MSVESTILASITLSAPEMILAVGALFLLMVGVFAGEKSSEPVSWLGVLVIIFAGGWIVFNPGEGLAYGGAFVADAFGRFMKLLVLIGSAGTLVMSISLARQEKIDKFEYPVLIVLATLGMLLMISANDLISLYMSLELQSLSLYVVAAMNRDSAKSTEAGLKYFVLGALSSGMMLYGMSLVYGFTGHTGFPEIAAAISAETRSLGLVFGLVFVFAGLAFKISAVPFHMWTPDVYEGAPTPVTAFFAAAPKVAAMALTVRVAIDAFQPLIADWRQIVVFISIASMVLGAFAAIGQTNIKRLMAYSSIGHVGYALVGLAAGNQEGVSGVVLYMAIYMVMTLGSFAVILSMRTPEGEPLERIDDLAGLSTTNPMMAVVFTILMFSLAGIPPLAGFFAKYFVFVAAIKSGLYALSVIGVLASVVGAYYYLRIVKLMWFDGSTVTFGRVPGAAKLVYSLSGLFVVGYVLFGGRIGVAAEAAAKALFLMGHGQSAYRLDTFRHIALDDVGSTNTECLERARAGDPGRLWITARRQLGGRGRRGRAWVSEPGNLYSSLLLVDPAPQAALASLPLVVALALHRAISAEMPFADDRIRIKWPNDILVDGRKVSGILIEAEGLPDGRNAVVIGCGVNIAHKPENPLYPATSLSEAGASTSPEALFARLMVELAHALDVWKAGAGIDEIVASWKALVHGIGGPITVNLPDRSLSGIFAGIEKDGLLALRLDSGETLRIASGDVFSSYIVDEFDGRHG